MFLQYVHGLRAKNASHCLLALPPDCLVFFAGTLAVVHDVARNTQVRRRLCMYVSIYLSICLSVFLSVCLYLYLYLYICVYVYITYISCRCIYLHTADVARHTQSFFRGHDAISLSIYMCICIYYATRRASSAGMTRR